MVLTNKDGHILHHLKIIINNSKTISRANRAHALVINRLSFGQSKLIVLEVKVNNMIFSRKEETCDTIRLLILMESNMIS